MIRKNAKFIAFDTETTGLNSWGDVKRWGFYPARPFAFSFCDDKGNTEYFRFKVDPFTRQVLYEKTKLRRIKELLRSDTVKIGHNLSYDLRMCEAIGIKVKGEMHDTLIMAHVNTGGSEMFYGLKELCKKYADFEDTDEKTLRESAIKSRNKGKKLGWMLAVKEYHGRDPIKADYWMADPKLCKKYAIQDAERTMLLFLTWYPTVNADPNKLSVYSREMKLFQVVRRMENKGTRVFPEDLVRLRKWYTKYRDKQKVIADAHGGKDLNFRSPTQMVRTFIELKKYEPMYWTKKGNPQINGDFLKHLADEKGDKLARAILEHRGSDHMITGFLNPYELFRTQEAENVWTLHPNYRQCGPVTGRFSCGDPNLMQVASPTTGRKRTEVSLRPREAFGPRPGHVWYLPDYSQIEVWVFSFLAEEKAMMQALLAGRDFHGAVAEQVWGNHPEFHTNPSYYRKRAKLLMFCKLYGGGVKKVAYLTDATEAEARQFVQDFDSRLPGVNLFMNRMVNRVRREGKILNPFGRTYYIDANFSYKAVNYLVQGTSADILKNAMIRIDKLFRKRWKGCHILLTLHDELVLEVPLEYHSKQLMREIIYEMQRDSALVSVPVPLPVGMKIAKHRWSDTKEIESLTDEWKTRYLNAKIENS